MVAFLTYLLKSSFCLTLLYGFYKLLCASTTRFSLNRWVLVGGMLTCLLLPFVSLELEHEPLVQSPFILMEEWKQPVDVVSASASGLSAHGTPDSKTGSSETGRYTFQYTRSNLPPQMRGFHGLLTRASPLRQARPP